MNQRPRLHGQRGSVLLLEMLIGLFLLSLVIVPIYTSLTTVAMAAKVARVRASAGELLQARAEEIKSQGWGSVPGDSGSPTVVCLENYLGTPFTVQETVEPTDLRVDPHDPLSDCLVWRILLRAYRVPASGIASASPLAVLEFYFYAEGL